MFIGCGHLWVTDGIWKVVFPHCMFRVVVCCRYIILILGNHAATIATSLILNTVRITSQ